ncbi:photosynthetic complex putative assembly protein PuhB [Roseomonas rosulenta]|uniref:photosynthetic complex putative assembly protein PuhB n=1 Tax=Roseomonas rosulenta TaxID=2748667 RepID=UPI0018DF43A6|nr:photosynthetic complex putative assembly protein PuhB [Roseomonas rosulenta]
MSGASARPGVTEHGFEPVPGLPERLPEGETLLWQGRPGWRGLARGALHVRGIAAYFAMVAAWQGASVATAGGSMVEAVAAAGLMLLIGAMPIAFLVAYAWMAARGAVYSITNRRIVMRVGVALPVTINLPFALVESAALSRRADGSGDLVLHLAGKQRASWIALWPHCRPWRFTRPEPMLRALPDAEAVAQVLGRALAAAAAMPVTPIAGADAPRNTSRPGAEAMA